MILFEFARKYIYKKALNHSGAFIAHSDKIQCIDNIKYSTSYLVIKNAIQSCKKDSLHSIANYIVIIEFGIYAQKNDYPYDNKSFSLDFITDFLWILTSYKKTSTKAYYRTILVSFVKDFNLNIHGTNRDISIFVPKSYSLVNPPFTCLSIQEVNLLLTLAKSKCDKINLMIQLLLKTGIRVSEMLNIKEGDLRWVDDLCMIKIKGKGSLFRFVAIKRKAIHKLYMEISTKKDINAWLFKTEKNEKISRQYVYTLVKNLLSSIGIHKVQNGPHVLRHTFATIIYEKHKDIILTQELMGHISLRSTATYIHKSKAQMAIIADTMDAIA